MSRVLVVEDEVTTQAVFSNVVTQMGHEVVVCGNGLEALGMIVDRRSFDVLIVDVVLPGLDGRDLVRRLRTHTCLADVPVIITSARVGPKEIGNLLDMGNTLFLSKPVDAQQLTGYIERCLQWRKNTVGRQFRQGIGPLAEGCAANGMCA